MSIHLYYQPKKTPDGIVGYYSLAKSIKVDGKFRKKIIYRIGRLDEPQAEAFRAFLKLTQNPNELENFCNIKNIQITAEIRYLDVLVMNFLWDQFDLSRAFKKSLGPNEKISTDEVAKILTINRVLNPASKIRTIAWLNRTMLPKIMGINPADYTKSKIFRELENINGSKDKLEKLMWDFSSRFKSSEFDVYFFDGTTSWFEGNKCPLAKYDLEKTRGIYPQVISLMLVTDKSGYPIAWDVENGNTKDVSCFSKIVKRLYFKYGVKRITICYDRGIASKENFELPSEVECKFISGIRDNQIKEIFDLNKFKSTKTKILKNQDKVNENGNRSIVSISGFTSNDKNIWFKDLGIKGQYRYIVSFNIEACKVEKEARNSRLRKFLEFVSKKNDELKLAKKSRDFNATERDLLDSISKHKLNGLIEYKLLPIVAEKKYNSFQIECSIKRDKSDDLELTDGIMVYITDHVETDPEKGVVLSASDITAYYKRKYIIENSFRELKSFLDLRPFHVWKEQHVRAHYDLAIIGYFIRVHVARTLEQNADERSGDVKTSVSRFFNLLSENANVVQILCPNGNILNKIKAIPPPLMRCLSLFNIDSACLDQHYTAHGVCV